MTDIQKIAAVIASALPDDLKLELVGLITNRQSTQPAVIQPWYPFPVPYYPINPCPASPTIYPTWIASTTGRIGNGTVADFTGVN